MSPIYVDFDDVLSDTTRTFLKILKLEYGKSVNFEDIFSFDLKASFNLTESEYAHFFQRVHQPDVIMAFPPVDGAIGTLENWVNLGYQISIVTGRLTSAYEASLGWLAKHNVPYHSFTMVDKYSRENIYTQMAISMQEFSEMQFSFAVEDSATMALHLSQKMGIPVALMDRPWNRSINLNYKINRYKSWPDIRNDFLTP
ncbi:MAG: bifunctional metallophosphatase/5'-nucleotidase [Desulfobacterales bacterium]|jgi:uncharacterized HAD superfamily protein